MNCELMLTYDTPALRQTGSRNLTGQKTLPTIWGTYRLEEFYLYKSFWLFSSPCHRQRNILPSLGVRRPLTFHILIFSSETSHANELKLGRKHRYGRSSIKIISCRKETSLSSIGTHCADRLSNLFSTTYVFNALI
jgi:hypothetical protein